MVPKKFFLSPLMGFLGGRSLTVTDADTQVWVTCSDDLFDLNEGGVDLFGELPHGLIWVLVGKRVDVNLHRYKNSTIIIVSQPRSFKTVCIRLAHWPSCNSVSDWLSDSLCPIW